jgi:hypothetical protein
MGMIATILALLETTRMLLLQMLCFGSPCTLLPCLNAPLLSYPMFATCAISVLLASHEILRSCRVTPSHRSVLLLCNDTSEVSDVGLW